MLSPEDLAQIAAIVRAEVRNAIHPSARAETNVVPLRASPLPANDPDHPDAPEPPTAA